MGDNQNSYSYLKSLVRERDMDRYLAILLGPRAQQPALMALAALNVELAHVLEAAKEPGLSAIRFQWWRDCFEEAHGLSGNPVVDAVNEAARQRHLPLAKIIDLIDGHEGLQNMQSGDDGDEIKLLAVDGPLFELMALVLGGTSGADLSAASKAAALALASAKFSSDDILLREKLAKSNLRECSKYLKDLPPEILVAFLPVSLVDFYLKGDGESPSGQLRRIWTLWRAHRKQSL